MVDDDFQGCIEKQVRDDYVKMEEQNQVEANLRGRVIELEKKLAECELCISVGKLQYSKAVLKTRNAQLRKEAREHEQEKQNLEAYYKCLIDGLIKKVQRTNRYRTEEKAAYEDRIKKLKKRLKDAKRSNKEEESATHGKETNSVNKQEESATHGKDTNSNNTKEKSANRGKMKKLKAVALSVAVAAAAAVALANLTTYGENTG